MASIRPEFVQAAVRIRNHSRDVWGTGFGYARPDDYNETNPKVHSTNERWRLWYVTCAHVIDAIEARSGLKNRKGVAFAQYRQPPERLSGIFETASSQIENQQRVYVEVNEELPQGGRTSIGYPIGHFWTRHRDWMARCSKLGPIASRAYELEDAAVDVAVTTAPTHYEKWNELEAWGFPPHTHMTKALMAADNLLDQPLSEGDEVFVVGFPTGFYEDLKNWPTVRQGVLAQIQPYLRGQARTFLIDGSVFGGNSGGPVVTKPQPVNIGGTQQFVKSALIGMVSGCRLNPTSGENADLGIVVPLDTINDTIEMALKRSQKCLTGALEAVDTGQKRRPSYF